MKIKYIVVLLTFFLINAGCSKDNEGQEPREKPNPDIGELYFPEIGSTSWETISPETLNWNTDAEADLYQFLNEKNTKAFLILKNGRMAVEKYYGTFTKDSTWYWASAGKTLTSFAVGIAQEQGLLSIEDATSDFLGEGWTTTTSEEEAQIKIRHQLTMTSGLKNNPVIFSCTTPQCLKFEAEPGTRWSYHNGPYTLLQSVVSNAANTTWTNFYNTNLRDMIGMNGIWTPSGNNNIYVSTARSMARFGLLNLNQGKWHEQTILADSNYLEDMKTSSQDLNQSYGYLWWLNGEASHMGVADQQVFSGELFPNAPADTYAALGANDQKIYVVPSQGLVVVRMGESAGGNSLGPSSFDNQLWEKISAMTK